MDNRKENDLFQVGIITSTHGIKGEVKVFPTTDDVNRFRKLKNVILKTEKETFNREITGVKFFKQFGCGLFRNYNLWFLAVFKQILKIFDGY